MKLAAITRNNYIRGVLTLMTGTSLAQIVPIAVSPILTRLYNPDDFGHFALYTAIATTASVLVTARYEQAINLPKQDDDGFQIVALSMFLTVIISGILFAIIIIFAPYIAQFLGDATLANWMYFVPISTLVIGFSSVLSYWCNRRSQYGRIAISRTTQTITSAGAQIGGGYHGAGIAGLVGAQLIGQSLSMIMLAYLVYKKDRTLVHSISYSRIINLARRYSTFPRYMILGQLFSTASGYMPLFVLGFLYGPAVAGFYALSQRILLAPLSLIGSAIGEVYRSEASKHYREQGNCIHIYKKTVLIMSILSLAISLPAFFWGPDLFAMAFGQSWRQAGEVASILAILIFFQGISSPTSETLLFARFVKTDLVWQAFRFAASIGSLYLGYRLSPLDSNVSILFFVITFSVLYVVHALIQYSVAAGNHQ